MKSFYLLLVNMTLSNVTNNFVWFALTFWVYLETKSVMATAYVAGTYLVATALSSLYFGAIVDHNKKKTAMLISSFLTLALFSAGLLFYQFNPAEAFTNPLNPQLWVIILILMLGVIAGNMRNIAFPTVTTILVPEDRRDRANGLTGSMTGIAFAITSFGSGLALAYTGMLGVLLIAVGCTILAIFHLLFISIPEDRVVHSLEDKPKKVDIKGTIAVIAGIHGLFALIFFTTFNNFLGGVFMSLMDAYGLTLVSVQVWGAIFGFLSLGFIAGGLYIHKFGLGKNPLKTLFTANIIMWTVCIFFTIQPSIILLIIGMFIWICLVPFIEATEQTIIQKVVPLERQGRVFGLAQTVEQSASPITAFLIGPIAQFIFIPFMTTGVGVGLIGDWFGTGVGRGIALVFTIAGLIGLTVTLIARQSNSYKLLSARYKA